MDSGADGELNNYLLEYDAGRGKGSCPWLLWSPPGGCGRTVRVLDHSPGTSLHIGHHTNTHLAPITALIRTALYQRRRLATSHLAAEERKPPLAPVSVEKDRSTMPQDAPPGGLGRLRCLRFACGLPDTLFDRLPTTIALDILGHYALTDKVFETPGWSKVVMVVLTWMKPVKLIGAGRRDIRGGKMSAASISTTVTKPGRLPATG
jgi:hypothetical protein